MLEGAYLNEKYQAAPKLRCDCPASWKAKQIERMLKKQNLTPQTICEVGCEVGEVLEFLQKGIQGDCTLWGYDTSPQAIALCTPRANERLHFQLADLRQEQDVVFDLLLVLDLIEHLEDRFDFLRALKSKSQYKIFHMSLDISLQTVLRRNGLLYPRDSYGHISYYTKETALRTLQDAGYEVIDYFYTPKALDLPTEQLKRKIVRLPRKWLFNTHQDFAVRMLGGFGLLVLAR